MRRGDILTRPIVVGLSRTEDHRSAVTMQTSGDGYAATREDAMWIGYAACLFAASFARWRHWRAKNL
jgi:hypothetical protein